MRPIVLAGFLALAGISALPAAAGDDGFDHWFVRTALAAGHDPDYHRIPLDSSRQSKAFVDVVHRLYLHEITPEQFSASVDAVYPGHQYEIDFLIRHLPR